MKSKFLRAFVLAATVFSAFATLAPAQTSSICISRIQQRLNVIGRSEFSFLEARRIIRDFDFGRVSQWSAKPGRQQAFAHVFSNLSYAASLAPSEMSGKGLLGLTRYSGGIIRKDGSEFIQDMVDVFGGAANFDGPGFNAVMEQLETTGEWLAQGKWKSPGGLVFRSARANRQGHRVSHIFTHTIDGWKDPPHSVFSVSRSEVLPLIDEAWAKRGSSLPNQPGTFDIDMNRTVGTKGEKKIRIIVGSGTENIISAHPVS